MIKIWADKIIQAGEQIGYVGGRFGKNNEGLGNAHLHFSATVAKGVAVDLRKAISEAGVNLVKAYENTPYEARVVRWDGNLGLWVNDSEKLVLDRHPQLSDSSGAGVNQNWLAWEKDVPVGDMKRVVWKEVDRIIVNNKEQGVMRWVKADSSIWTTSNNVWNTNSQSWGNYQR